MLEKPDVLEICKNPRDDAALVELDHAVAELNTRAQEGNLIAFALVYWKREPERTTSGDAIPTAIRGAMYGTIDDLNHLIEDLYAHVDDVQQAIEDTEQTQGGHDGH